MSSRNKARWLSEAVVLSIHESQIAEHGGKPGLRDAALLASALARPHNAAAYRDAPIVELAACYDFGIIRNHPFFDGNKRTGAVALELFLDDNGYQLQATDAEIVQTILRVASGEMNEKSLGEWTAERAKRRGKKKT